MRPVSLLDRTRAALARALAPKRSGGTRVYAAAAHNRLTGDWYRQILSADQELKGDLKALRGASRQLVRDNAYAARYVNLIADNVVGPYGIRLQAAAQTTRDGLHASLNARLERAWLTWTAPANASADGRLSWTSLTQLVCRTLPADGEVFLRLVRGADNDFGFAVQQIDADCVDEQYSVEASKGPHGAEVRMGVEVDRWGKPLGYWCFTDGGAQAVHPSEIGSGAGRRRREFIPASEMLHLYRVLRPGQTRGVPWFAPILLDQKMLAGYQEAEITAARIGASNMAAIQQGPDADVDPSENPNTPVEMEPGAFFRLKPGESLVGTSFDHPSTAFAPFTKAILRSIAAGLGVSYTSLTGDLEAVNYSSIRAGLLQERDAYRTLQEWLTDHLHRPVFTAWVPFAALNAGLPAREYGPDEVQWQARGWAWVDPLKDMEAAALAVREGFTTRTAVCAEVGDNFAEIIAQLKAEQTLAHDAGVTLGEADLKPGAQLTTPTPDEAQAAAAARAAESRARRFRLIAND